MIIERVEDQVLYHIQQGPVPNGGHSWDIGRKDYWGHERNFVMKNIFDSIGTPLINKETGQPINAYLAFKEMYRALIDQTASTDCTTFLRKNIDSILYLYVEMFASLSNHHYVLREYIYEEVRKEIDPTLPSRLTGLWITPEEDLDFWWHALSPQETNTIVKLKLTEQYLRDIAIGNQDSPYP